VSLLVAAGCVPVAQAGVHRYTIRASRTAMLVHVVGLSRAEPVRIGHDPGAVGYFGEPSAYDTVFFGAARYRGGAVLVRVQVLPAAGGQAVRAMTDVIAAIAHEYAPLIGAHPRIVVRGSRAVLVNPRHRARAVGVVLTGEHWPGGDAIVVYDVPPEPPSRMASARLALRLTFDTDPAVAIRAGYPLTTTGPAAAAVAALDATMAAQPHYRARFDPVGYDPFGGALDYEVVPADSYYLSRSVIDGGIELQRADAVWLKFPDESCYHAAPEFVLTPEQLRFASFVGAIAAHVSDNGATRTLVVIGYFGPTDDQPFESTYTIDRATGLALTEVDASQFEGRPVIRIATWDYTTPVAEVTPNACVEGRAPGRVTRSVAPARLQQTVRRP
jgi:hypothetical protein